MTEYYQNKIFSVEKKLFYEDGKRLGYFEDEIKEEIMDNNHKKVVDRLSELKEENIELKRINKNIRKENEQLKQQLKTKVIVNRQYEELQKLKKENEKLKQFIDDLTTEGTGRIDLANGYSYNVNVLLTNIKGDD